MFGRKKIKELEERIQRLEDRRRTEVLFPPPMFLGLFSSMGFRTYYPLRDVVWNILEHLNLKVEYIPSRASSIKLVTREEETSD